MPEVRWLLSDLGDLRAILDVLVVTTIIYWLLWVAQGTRATQLIRGAIIFFAVAYFLARSLHLATLNWILTHTWPALIIAIPVIFQPELRRALEQLGHTGSWIRTSFPTSPEENIELSIDEIVRAAAQLARLRFGALMVLERETGLQDYADRGVVIDGQLSRQLLVTIFFPNSPLHDAAVLIRGNRILAASVVLPLTDNISPTGQLGTRHRAAIGVTEDSDALAVVVSEESGQIAVTHNGRLIRNLDQDRLRRVLRTLMRVEPPEGASPRSNGRIRLPERATTAVKRLPGSSRRRAEPTKTGST